jgi:HTH-type transcriptional regulator/antitoxin MqsA
MCSSATVPVEEPAEITIVNRTVTIPDRFYRCTVCGETFYLSGMMDDSLRRATAVIRAEDGLLAPDEIVGLRKKYGLTQADLERLIGAGPKTVVRWERGTVAQNRTADTLLRVLLEHPEVVAGLKRQNGLSKPARRRSSATIARKSESASAARK